MWPWASHLGSWTPAALYINKRIRPVFLNFDVHTIQVGILLKYRFWFSRLGAGLKFCISNKLLDAVYTTGLKTTSSEVRSWTTSVLRCVCVQVTSEGFLKIFTLRWVGLGMGSQVHFQQESQRRSCRPSWDYIFKTHWAANLWGPFFRISEAVLNAKMTQPSRACVKRCSE